MKKQLQIGFAIVVILLILESVRALAGTLDQIEIKIVTQDMSTEVVDRATATPGTISMEPVYPTNTPQAAKERLSSVQPSTEKPSPTAWPTSTSERPEIFPSSTPRITFTPVPTEKPVWKKYIPPSNGGTKDSSPGDPASAPTEMQEPQPTSAPTNAPLPTSAPPEPSDGAPTGATDSLPTAAPPPEGP